MADIYRHTRFLTSVYDARRLPPDEGAEVAFAGRSNAGKSSAINAVCQQTDLAQISKTPGRTRTINFFSIISDRRLVDLPGYGYAQVPPAMRRHWQALVEHYLRHRRCLRGLMLMMDIRHPLTDYDWQLLGWGQQRQLLLHILLTKSDKLSRGGSVTALRRATSLLRTRACDVSLQTFSALKRQGVEEAHDVLDGWLEL